MNAGHMQVNTSNRNYLANELDWGNVETPSDVKGLTMCILADMDAGDTATTLVVLSGGGLAADVEGDATDAVTIFSGKLEA